MISVHSLHIYPVKSLQGIDLKSARLGIRGLQYDRTWMVTDAQNKFITQRHYPKLARIQVELTQDQMTLSHPSMDPLCVDLEDSHSDQLEATIWDDKVKAMDEGKEASQWLTQVLGTIDGHSLKLLRYHPDHIRHVSQKHLRDEAAHTAFADGFPFLITSVESLGKLNEVLQNNGSQPVGMNRFRPNIVIRGVEPFGENSLDTLASNSGEYGLGIRKPCQRCHVTTIDQSTGQKIEPKEPLRTLLQMDTQPGLEGAYFGQNSILLFGKDALIQVGDQLSPS
ncbi:MAG: MOSC N-terminal beta barrel domain-containing protein [Candidatus Marinimicrobia bacterium]|nr:MOSC N-terminal beta barrel domain-containing protein [Candidatus Neomarinimicrobiota bacterium]MCF7850274.1 MOSC N-terminal beta barrel domain-containing protein [Candidatus Neomarinimicrobiota bacterium]MCF7903829.1 MOSC N-terminal beta barrel domain-containing protein [Candidatus Neomarinimicrobiota bacterium]